MSDISKLNAVADMHDKNTGDDYTHFAKVLLAKKNAQSGDTCPTCGQPTPHDQPQQASNPPPKYNE